MYKYKAINNEGEYVEGESEHLSEAMVVAELKKKNFIPITVTGIQHNKKKAFINLRKQNFSQQQFFENLFDYLDSGLSIDKALELEAKSFGDSVDHEFITEIVDEVRQGGSFSNALKQFPEYFSPLHIGIMHVGEETDSLTDSLSLLASLSYDLQEFREKIKSALIYPFILSMVMFISILVLFGLVVPKFKSMFEGMGVEVSGITAIIVSITDVLTQH
jgi:type II secretory pathway component PulF